MYGENAMDVLLNKGNNMTMNVWMKASVRGDPGRRKRKKNQ